MNNRVDAYNYCLVDALNRKYNAEGKRFILVTNSKQLRRIDARFRDLRFSRSSRSGQTGVSRTWAPRFAAIHQLLSITAVTADVAERFGWQIVERIVTYRAFLSKLLSGGDARTHQAATQEIKREDWARPDDLFIRLISSISALQERIESIQHSRRQISADKRFVAHWSDPATLHGEVQKTLKTFKGSAPFRRLVPATMRTPAANIVLDLEIEKGVSEDGFCRGRLIDVGNKSTSVCGLYQSRDCFGLYFESPCSLEEFLAVANLIGDQALADYSAGFPGMKKKQDECVVVRTESGVEAISKRRTQRSYY